MLHNDIPLSITTSSGTGSQNTGSLVSALIKLILVNAPSTTITFDFKIINYRNDIIYHKEGITGILRENNIEIPVKNIATLRIETASSDGDFTGLVTIQEVFGR